MTVNNLRYTEFEIFNKGNRYGSKLFNLGYDSTAQLETGLTI
jgi:hypothetical protein